MKIRQHLYPLCFAILLMACDKQQKADTVSRTEMMSHAFCGLCRPAQWHPGEIDDQGRLVVFESAQLTKTLESDYALVFLNTGDQDHPEVRYDLSSRESGYESYATLDALMERIDRIPEPRIIDFYGTCGAPPFDGLPEKQIRAFFDAMKEAHVELKSGDHTTICTCPCPRCN